MRTLGISIFALSLAALGQNRDTLETKVTAEGKVIVLEWSKKHPWADQFGNGAYLRVSYATKDHGVGQDCLGQATAATRGRTASSPCLGIPARPSTNKQERTLYFPLPDKLTAPPIGPVCLQIVMPNQRALPIRQVGSGVGDTSLFRYEPWEKAASRQSEMASANLETSEIENRLNILKNNVKVQGDLVAKRYPQGQKCEDLSVKDVFTGSKPQESRPLAATKEDQDQFARLVCVMRVSNIESYLTKHINDPENAQYRGSRGLLMLAEPNEVFGPPTYDDILKRYKPTDPNKEKAWKESRQTQIQQYRQDWERLSPQVEAYQQAIFNGNGLPHFGSLDDVIRLGSAAMNAASKRLFAQDGQQFQDTDLFGVLGGIVESYSRCVDDGRNQIVTTYQNSKNLAADTDRLQERARLDVVADCKSAFKKRDEYVAGVSTLETELQENRQRRTQLTSLSFPTGKDDLNGKVCRQ